MIEKKETSGRLAVEMLQKKGERLVAACIAKEEKWGEVRLDHSRTPFALDAGPEGKQEGILKKKRCSKTPALQDRGSARGERGYVLYPTCHAWPGGAPTFQWQDHQPRGGQSEVKKGSPRGSPWISGLRREEPRQNR